MPNNLLRTRVPIEARLKRLLPDESSATYVGQRMVKLSVEDLEEVIATIEALRDGAGERRPDE